MASVQGQAMGHLVRRGIEVAQSHFTPSADTMARLRNDAELYENAGPDMEVDPSSLLPVVVTVLLLLLGAQIINYTLGSVMATLTMIESPSATAVFEDKPPAYTDEPDAPLEKEPFITEADVEVTLIPNRPVTAKIRTTMKLLRQTGGWRSYLRGAPFSFLYHAIHSILTNLLASFFGFGLMGNALMYIISSVGLARLHMAWTHGMIAKPSTTPFYARMVPRKQCKALVLPAFVFATAQQATFILPMIVAFAVGLPNMDSEYILKAAHDDGCGAMMSIALRVLAVPATAIFVAFAILLPATVTLTRIEALLLLDTEETIVPFDREAIMGDIDMAACGSSRKLFVSAWRSFDRASRWRLIKLYAKLVMIQISVVFVGLHVMAAELWLIGGERLGLLFKSGAAQIQLMIIEGNENAQ